MQSDDEFGDVNEAVEKSDKCEIDEDYSPLRKIEKIHKALEADDNVISKSTLEQRKRDGLCPQCGEKGDFAPITFAMTCSKHGAY